MNRLMTEQLVNDLIANTEANMKATYRVKSLPKVSKSFRIVQSNSKDELFEALGFCDPRSGVPVCRYQEETRNGAIETPVTSAYFRPLIREE
jgi:hypothetical protein